MAIAKQKETRFLEKRIVKLKPIIRPGKWSSVFEDDRPGESFMYPSAKRSYPLPNKEGTLTKVSILDAYEKVKTPDYQDEVTEQEFFERKLFLDPGELSVYNNKSQFWKEFRVMVSKNGLELNLSDPMDMLRYKCLLACKTLIAPDWESRFYKGSYEFVLVEAAEILKNEKKQGEVEDAATMEFLKIKNDINKLKDVLKLRGLRIADNSTDTFVEQEIRKFVKESPDKFLEITADPNFEIKIMLRNAVKVGALEMPATGVYALPGGIKLGVERDAVNYLEDPENYAIKQKIINQIENTK